MPGVAICNKPGVLKDRMEHNHKRELATAGGPEDGTRATPGLTIAAMKCMEETEPAQLCNLGQVRVI
jgi:hypothetical protein